MTEQTNFDNSYTQNRELSWLKFNERVLDEALDEQVPLYERLKFAAIFTSNLDEFFMVRVGSLTDLALMNEPPIDNKSGMDPLEQLQAIFQAVRPLYAKRDLVVSTLEQNLRAQDIASLNINELTFEEYAFVKEYFNDIILPVLSPQIIDRHHPFPHLVNKALYVAALLKGEDNEDIFGIIPIPPSLPKALYLRGSGIRYLLTEKIVEEFAQSVFTIYQIQTKSTLSVTRNADISPNDEGYDDYLYYMKKILKKRARLAPVRLEMKNGIGVEEHLVGYLCDKLGLEETQVYLCDSPLVMSYVYSLVDKLSQAQKRQLCYPSFIPQPESKFKKDESIIKSVSKRDCLLSFPYQSMDPFLRLIKEAAYDPTVMSIKITIYRLANKSRLVEYLNAAAERGKEVTVLIELRARFDEENNINWAEMLEEAGCTVIYGLDGFKVHSKICLITRKEKNKISYITQIGTGNYNEKTAQLYTDFSLITSRDGIGRDAAAFFNNMAISNLEGEYNELLIAPAGLKKSILSLIEQEIVKANYGAEAYILMKLNSLSDREVIDQLALASQAGVKVELIVRGICCLLPGVPGKTDHITVRSIVGRFLEHSRVYCFGIGDSMQMYISSADMMTRNTNRRVEIACPVNDSAIRQRILHMLDIMQSDNTKARILGQDGVYRKPAADGEIINCQDYFIQEAEPAEGDFLAVNEVKNKLSVFVKKIGKKKTKNHTN